MQPRVLSLVPRGRTGCYLWRSVWPSDALKQRGFAADYEWFDDFQEVVRPKLLSGEYNTIVTPRMCFLEDWMEYAWQALLNQAKVAWVYEVDDDLFSEPIVERFFRYSDANGVGRDVPEEERSIRLHVIAQRERRVRTKTLGLVDAVTVSCSNLAEVVQQHTQAPVHIVPNAIDVDWFSKHMQLDQPRLSDHPLTVGWAGGWRPGDDTALLAGVWPRLAERFPDVHFVLIGWVPPEILAGLPADQLTVYDWQDLDTYPYYLRNIDIACCVVADNVFNASKTPIKFFESTLAGSTVVASTTLYGQVITNGYNGLLASNEESWERSIASLIEHPRLRQRLHAHAERTVLDQHTIDNVWPAWLDAFQDALARSPRVGSAVAA